MCFLIITDHTLEHAIGKTVIGDNWQNQQLHTIINDYFANAQSNLAEPQLIKNSLNKQTENTKDCQSYIKVEEN
jgi:hypothetical protein